MQKILTAFGIKISGALIGLLTTILITRILDKNLAGEIFVFFSALAVLTAVSKLGIESPIVRRVICSLHDKDKIKTIFSAQLKTTLQSSVFIALSIAIILFFNSQLLFTEHRSTAIITLSITIILETILACSARFIQGSEKPYIFLLVVSLQKLFLFILLSINYLSFPINSNNIYLLIVISYIPCLIILAFIIKKIFPEIGIKLRIANKEVLDLLKEGLPLLLIGVVAMLAQHLSVFTLQIMKDNETVADYAVCFRVVSTMGFLLIAANTIASPHIAKSYEEQGINFAYGNYRSYTKKIIALCIPIFIGILFLGKQILGIFGSSYKDLYLILLIMSIGQIFNIATGTISSLYIMTKQSNIYRNISISVNLLGIIATPLFIYIYGITGSAIAYSLVMTSSNLFMHYYFKYRILQRVIN